jgi:phospholipid/cholesterol/gamma-HCH transport system substrate-binding protein
MEPKVNYVAVGAFILLLGLSAFAAALWLGKTGYGKAYDRYYAFMRESVSGLSVDAPVKYRGVEVGRVEQIALNPANSEEVRLTLDILHGTPIKRDTVAVLDTQVLTGLAIVNLRGGSRDSPLLAPEAGKPPPAIPAGPSLYFQVNEEVSRLLVDRSASKLLADLDALAVDFRDVVSKDNRAALRKTFKSLERVTGRLDARGPEIERSAGKALSDADLLIAQLRELAATLDRAARRVERQPNLLLFGSSPGREKGPGE